MPLVLVKRLVKGIPILPSEEDNNMTLIETYINGFTAELAASLNPDGTLKVNSVATAAIQDRAVTLSKLAFLSSFYAEDTGGVNAIGVTFTPAATAYAEGMVLYVKMVATNTNPSVTLKMDTLAAVAVKQYTSAGIVALVAGNLQADGVYCFVHDGTQWIVLNPTPITVTPTSGPTFVPIPVIVYSGGAIGWTTYDASLPVPDGAKAVILQCAGFWNSAVDGEIITEIRKDNTSNSLVLNDVGGTDAVRSTTQGLFPITSDRKFDYRVVTSVLGTTSSISLIGYVM